MQNYSIVVILQKDVSISFQGRLIEHQNLNTAGFQILDIGKEDLLTIQNLVDSHQGSPEFVKQVEKDENVSPSLPSPKIKGIEKAFSS